MPSSSTRSLVNRRTLLCLFGVVAVGAIALALSTVNSGQSGTSTLELGSAPSVIRTGVASGLEGMPLVSLEYAEGHVAPEVKIPQQSLVGRPVSVALVASHAADPNDPSTAEQGLIAYFERGVLYSAQPLGDSSGPDFSAPSSVSEDDVLQWEDGRKDAYTLAQVNGHAAMVQPGGIKSGGAPSKERYPVNPAVIWVEGGVEYTLESESLSATELQAIAEGISRQF